MKSPKTFTAITRQYFYPELTVCPHCGQCKTTDYDRKYQWR